MVEIKSWITGKVLIAIEAANLRGANLTGADLEGANLRGADLRGADLRDADLRDADLRGADLRGADLRGADLRGADIEDANLRGADLEDARSILLFNKLGGRTCYAVIHSNTLMIKAGCFWGNLRDFEKKCKETYLDNPAEAYEYQIEYLKGIEQTLKK